MFYGRGNANYIHANRYPVAAAQNPPQQFVLSGFHVAASQPPSPPLVSLLSLECWGTSAGSVPQKPKQLTLVG